MKGIVVHDTSYGNTRKIAETIAETLKESGMEVDLFYVMAVKKLSAEDYDFFVLLDGMNERNWQTIRPSIRGVVIVIMTPDSSEPSPII